MDQSIKKYELKKNDTGFDRVTITSSKAAYDVIKQFYFEDIGIFESFFILLLDNSNSTIGYAKISQGGITGTVVDPIIVAKYAVDSLAKGIVIAHNHPSGQLKASGSDIKITQKIKDGLNLFDIRVLDHVILTEDGYFSFADRGIL